MGSEWGIRWTDERVALLKKLHAQGLSFRQIADRLGVTRLACAGKIDRLGLSVGRGLYKQKPKAERKRSWAPPTVSMLPALPDGFNIPTVQRRTFLQLANGVCKYPFGEPQSPNFFFCGGDALDGKPYCLEHCLIAYRPQVTNRP